VIAMIVRKTSVKDIFARRHERGILFSSGLVAGDALIGVGVAGLMVNGAYKVFYDSHAGMWGALSGAAGPYISLVAFAGVTLTLWMVTREKRAA
jgi:hypothetical protein